MSDFRLMAKAAGVAMLFGVAAALAGCASNIEQLRNVEPTGGTAFTQALASEYRDFTVFEADEMY
ncbi:MAG: hypothetical protein AB7S71_14380, partial [Dongiaceae bacterium]